jgi:hypothetical protein
VGAFGCKNVMAVEVLNKTGSSDLHFDLEVKAVRR